MRELCKNLAVTCNTLAFQNIRANAICPYYIETPLLSAAPPEVYAAWKQGTPARRLGKVSEVAKVFIYLACEDSSYCNGTQIILDGGVMA